MIFSAVLGVAHANFRQLFYDFVSGNKRVHKNTKRPSKNTAVGWLRIADLRSLDVVLSQSSHLASKLSARLARGEFSHASFVIDEHYWFDAVPAGCGIYSPVIDAVLGDDGWYLDMRPYRRIKILRHPIVALLSDQRRADLQELAREYCDGMIGTNYARYEKLLPLVRYPVLGRLIARWPKRADKFARTIDRLHAVVRPNRGMRGVLTWESILGGYKGTSSYFCSEVIVNIHEALGLDIARDGTSAVSFTPDDLCDEARSLLRPVDIVRYGSPIAKQDRRNREADKLIAESEHIITLGAKMLREIEDENRKSLSKERLENYLANAALRPLPELAEKAFRIRSGIAAVLKDCNRLLQLNLNLKDLEDTAKARPATYANQSFQEWSRVVEQRLRVDNPISPHTQELARAGLAELGSSTAKKKPAAHDLHHAFKKILRNCSILHAAALQRTIQLLKR